MGCIDKKAVAEARARSVLRTNDNENVKNDKEDPS